MLCGAGGTFCAGADLKGVGGTVAATGPNRRADGPMGPTRMRLGKPVIAAIAGYAVAGGLELALWCDLRVAEEDAVFGVFCRRWGVPLIDGGTVRLPRLIGLSRAMDMILTGRAVSAAEACGGLVNRVVPDGQARAAAQELAAQLAALPQACLRSDRMSALEVSSVTRMRWRTSSGTACDAAPARHGRWGRPVPRRRGPRRGARLTGARAAGPPVPARAARSGRSSAPGSGGSASPTPGAAGVPGGPACGAAVRN